MVTEATVPPKSKKCDRPQIGVKRGHLRLILVPRMFPETERAPRKGL